MFCTKIQKDHHYCLPVGSYHIEKISRPSMIRAFIDRVYDILEGLRYSLRKVSEEEEKHFVAQTKAFEEGIEKRNDEK